MNNIAKLILESLKRQSQFEGLTIEQARNAANIPILLLLIDQSAMAEEGKCAYTYIYKDDSQLIIDDEGYIYCDEDTEIGILAD